MISRPKSEKNIKKRKLDHLKIALSKNAQIGNPGFDEYRLIHKAIPEINYDKIDTSTHFLGKKVSFPFFISCMTGGVERGQLITKNLAMAAQKYNIAMGVGSQRAAIEYPQLQRLFQIRKYAPDIPVIANIGLVQLNYRVGLDMLERIIYMVRADALALHLNSMQEAIQPEGERNFEGLLKKLKKIINKLSVPVIAKEVGFGLSYEIVTKLYDVGVRIFDTAGWGGTNWAFIEGERIRDKDKENLGRVFSNWGIPTVESIKMCCDFKTKSKDDSIVILGSGGVRNGIDIAKVIALGADLAGIAAPFAKAALISPEEVEKLIEHLGLELKIAMFGVGANNIKALKSKALINI